MMLIAPADFVNRQSEVQRIKELLIQAQHQTGLPKNVINFYGVMGIGKTSLLTFLRNEARSQGISCAYIDFSGGRYSVTPVARIAIIEDIINQLAIGAHVTANASRLEQAIRGYKAALRHSQPHYSSRATTNELAETTVSEFIHHLQQLLSQAPVFLLFDTTEEAGDLLVWLEHHVISELILHPAFLLLVAGRQQVKWSQFHVRARLSAQTMKPFTAAVIQEQLPDFAHLADGIFQITHGHPLANLTVARKLTELARQKKAPLNTDDIQKNQSLLIRDLRSNLIERQFLPHADEGLLAAFRAVAPMRRFDNQLLAKLLTSPQHDHLARNESFNRADRLIGLMRQTTIVDWSKERKGLVLDHVVRQQLEMDLLLNDKERYLAAHETAIHHYQQLLTIIQPTNYGINLLELLYHRAKLSELAGSNAVSVVDSLKELLLAHLEQLTFRQSSAEFIESLSQELFEEIQRDADLFEICGPDIKHLSGAVEGFTHKYMTSGIRADTSPQSVTPTKLRQVLTTYFNETELRDLCFDLRVDYESLPGTSKADKARELVAHFERRVLLRELIAACYRLRPNIDWSEQHS